MPLALPPAAVAGTRGEKHADTQQDQQQRPPGTQQAGEIDLQQAQVDRQEQRTDQDQCDRAKFLSFPFPL